MLRNKHGMAIAFFVIMLTALLSLVALVIDISHGYSTKTKLKNAVDLAAIAGANQLTTTDTTMTVPLAKDKALGYLNTNLTATIPGFTALTLSSTGLTIETGVYASMAFSQSDTDPAINSVKVSYTYNTSALLGYIAMNFDITDSAITAKQVAGTAAPGTAFPLAISTTILSNAAMTSIYDVTLTSDQVNMDHFFLYYNPGGSMASSGGANIDYSLEAFQYYTISMTATPPPEIMINSMLFFYDYDMLDNSSHYSLLYDSGNPTYRETYIVPVVEDSGMTAARIKAFLGFRIDDISFNGATLIYTIMGAIIPAYIDTQWGGLRIDSGVTDITDPVERGLLATAVGLVQ